MAIPSTPAAPPVKLSVDTGRIKYQATSDALNQFADVTRQDIGNLVSKNQPQVPLLMSPNGGVYSMAVDNNGNLSATLVRG